MTAARRRAGTVTAEFAIVLIVFLLFTCCLLEVARGVYLLNTLQMVTQRAAVAAATTDFRDAAAMDAVRRHAVFRTDAGQLPLGAPVTDAHVRIEYLSLAGPDADPMTPIAAGALPACAVNNRIACMQNAYGPSCIRLVRAQLCDPARTDSCARIAYRPLFAFVELPLSLPTATTIVSAEGLGARPGDAPCP